MQLRPVSGAERRREGRTSRGAAGFREPRPICLHGLLVFQPAKRLPEDLGSPDVRRHDDPVVHPLALPPRRHNPGAAEVRKMPGDLRLGAAQDLDEVADTDLLVAHEVQQPEPGVVSQRLKEPLHVVRLFRCHTLCIRIDVFEAQAI